MPIHLYAEPLFLFCWNILFWSCVFQIMNKCLSFLSILSHPLHMQIVSKPYFVELRPMQLYGTPQRPGLTLRKLWVWTQHWNLQPRRNWQQWTSESKTRKNKKRQDWKECLVDQIGCLLGKNRECYIVRGSRSVELNLWLLLSVIRLNEDRNFIETKLTGQRCGIPSFSPFLKNFESRH